MGIATLRDTEERGWPLAPLRRHGDTMNSKGVVISARRQYGLVLQRGEARMKQVGRACGVGQGREENQGRVALG